MRYHRAGVARECQYPECQFLVVRIGWRVDHALLQTAVVRHSGHGAMTEIIEGARDGYLAEHSGHHRFWDDRELRRRQRRTDFPFAYDPGPDDLCAKRDRA